VANSRQKILTYAKYIVAIQDPTTNSYFCQDLGVGGSFSVCILPGEKNASDPGENHSENAAHAVIQPRKKIILVES